MKVTFEAEVYEYNFGNGDMHLERSPYIGGVRHARNDR